MPKTRTLLTPRQERFVEAYVTHGNGSKAAIAAGYSPRTARAIACENLKKPAVAEEISKRWAKRQEDDQADARRVFDELYKMAFPDFSGIVDEGGQITPPNEWPPETWLGIKAVRYSEETVTDATGKKERVKYSAEIRTKGNLKQLDRLALQLGMYPGKRRRR